MLPDLLRAFEYARLGLDVAQRVMAFWGPVPQAPMLLGPFFAVGSVLAVALLTGVAIGALSALIVALLALYFLLTEVFGVSVEVAAVAGPRA